MSKNIPVRCAKSRIPETRTVLRIICFVFVSMGIFSCKSTSPEPEPGTVGPTPFTWTKPKHFPDPLYDFTKNPLTKEGVQLGRFLFYDGILSSNNLFGCGTCHQQSAAFTHHGHDLSHGVEDRIGRRNSPPVQNMAWSTAFFWDGGVHSLDLVPFVPIQNPVEMDETLPNVLEKLRNSKEYPTRFKAAFGTEEVTTERMMKAMSQFMLTMVSASSKYDYYALGDANALNATEKNGLALFKQNCSSCHAGELFTDDSFRNNGLHPLPLNDLGRFEVTQAATDLYKFKVPSLRNVGYTAPYMHDGRFYSLEEVLTHYANDASASPGMDSIYESSTLDPLLKKPGQRLGIKLSATEQKAIIAFLRTLNDESFIKDKALADPGVGTSL
jgi:cytochrome c peroxidase